MPRPRLIALLLALVTLAAYLPVAGDSFLNLDDDLYVTNNRVVQHGLTRAGIKWAFTTLRASHWHPLTWLSHMLDCELFGLNAGAQHCINVVFHTANAVLLLLLLFRLTGALWPSALVAALFAWHPLFVESVAWIAQRKNVLSTLFGLLALSAYTRYAQKRSKDESRARESNFHLPTLDYSLALIFYALGLMSKPMLVTLPFLMLLLDYWPLQRFPPSASRVRLLFRLALEKWPFFLLTAISCVVTFIAQRNAGFVPTFQEVPLDVRLGNALLSYALYLGKAVWPANLAVIYPLQSQLPSAEVAAAAVFLMVATWLAWRARRRCPYLIVGWLWFLGMLAPVSGLVQDYGEALSDRFTYVPLIGVFIAVAFGIKDLLARFQIGVVPPAAAAGLALGSCLVLTEHQLNYWRNNETLFSHAIAVTKDNFIAHNNLGVEFLTQNRQAEALANFQEAARIKPDWADIHNNLGIALCQTDNPEKALVEYFKAVQLNPNLSLAHNNFGKVLAQLGCFQQAMNQLNEAARLDPADPWPHLEMANALLKQGRDAEAIGQLRETLRLDPDNYEFLAFAAHVLAAEENPEVRNGKTALWLALKAYALTDGKQPDVLDNLGMAFAGTGDFTNAQAATLSALHFATAAKMKNLEPLRQRLELYKKHQPWRESFLFTNTTPKEILKN